MKKSKTVVEGSPCRSLPFDGFRDRRLVIASNRGPVTIIEHENGELEFQRGGGGLVTALLGLTQHVEATWIACALSDGDRHWQQGELGLDEMHARLTVKFIDPDPVAYEGYYNVIANPLLWFLQHSIWDFIRSPTINHATWQAWENGYVAINRLFAEAIAADMKNRKRSTLIMLQDYHLYLVPTFLRAILKDGAKCTLLHFIHIPWPGSEDWGLLPPRMRQSILEGLCGVDLLGFQTREDALNFIRTCESFLPSCRVNFRRGQVLWNGHVTHVRDFPISIDVDALRSLAQTEEVDHYRRQLLTRFGERQLIVRIDRTEPSKNIVRGFQAFDEMLDLYPEHIGKVQFLAFFVPSRLGVEEYQSYLDELMAAAGRVNARHGDSEWEPVRVLVGENYPRAVAALQIYDVLLVNSIADGMNLVAKEGPIVNECNGVVVLSERTGARQQLENGALVISPCDIFSTAEALHQGLTMPLDERRKMAHRLENSIVREDITDWLCRQLEMVERLGL